MLNQSVSGLKEKSSATWPGWLKDDLLGWLLMDVLAR